MSLPGEAAGGGHPTDSASPSRPKSRSWLVAVGGVVVVALIVVGLGVAGVIPGFHRAGSPTPPTSKSPVQYRIAFQESGLPGGTSWSVTLNGTMKSSTASSLTFTEPRGAYGYSVSTVTNYTVSPASGTATVSDENISLGLTFTAVPAVTRTLYVVTFAETGLGAGVQWEVTLNGTSLVSRGASLAFQEANGSYPFTVAPVSGYTGSPSAGTAQVHGGPASYSVTFSPISASFPLNFSETGLPVGSTWSVDLGGLLRSAASSSISFNETNGTYPYTVVGPSGYAPSPSGGSVAVSGRAVPIAISFSAITNTSSAYYTVTFSQSGLPGDILWGPYEYLTAPNATSTVAFGGSTDGSTFVETLPNGTYFWTMASASATNGTFYAPSPSAGSFSVAGAPVSVAIHYHAVSSGTGSTVNYTVTVSETGLPSGTYWAAVVGNAQHSAYNFGLTPTPLNISVPNGTYSVSGFASSYTVLSPPTINVSGAPVSVTLHFVVAYNVMFAPVGIANGSDWELKLNGSVTLSFGSGPLNFSLTNGSYAFSVYAFGYRVSPASGTVVVAGKSVNVTLRFTAFPTYSVTFSESGLPTGTNWSVNVLPDGLRGFSLGFMFLLGASGGSSGGTSFSMALPDGNYSWTGGTNSTTDYWPTPLSGAFDLNGAGTSISLVFAADRGATPILFLEEDYANSGAGGLPNGTAWGVDIGGVTTTTTGMVVTVLEPNGTYPYSLVVPAGYWALPGGGKLTVNNDVLRTNSSLVVAVAFFAGSPPTAPAGPSTVGPTSAGAEPTNHDARQVLAAWRSIGRG